VFAAKIVFWMSVSSGSEYFSKYAHSLRSIRFRLRHHCGGGTCVDLTAGVVECGNDGLILK
jgi:hypothetical protein